MNCIWMYYVADNNFQVTLFATLGAVWSGFIVFASMVEVVWSAFEYMQQAYQADDNFQNKG